MVRNHRAGGSFSIWGAKDLKPLCTRQTTTKGAKRLASDMAGGALRYMGVRFEA